MVIRGRYWEKAAKRESGMLDLLNPRAEDSLRERVAPARQLMTNSIGPFSLTAESNRYLKRYWAVSPLSTPPAALIFDDKYWRSTFGIHSSQPGGDCALYKQLSSVETGIDDYGMFLV